MTGTGDTVTLKSGDKPQAPLASIRLQGVELWDTTMLLSAGDRLGPYEILGPIGSGGMGEVYKARDSRLGREVAIKLLRGGALAGSDRAARFMQEARAA